MREKIILAPGARGSELIKNLAIYGVNCINLKVMGASELARYTLMKSAVAIKEEFVSSDEECTFIAKAIVDETYFGRTSYSDIKRIAQAVRNMRCLVKQSNEEEIIKETLSKGIFKEKNDALFRTYQNYMKLLKEDNALDSVLLIRKAINEGKAFDADFLVLDEYPLSPLEYALLEKISGGKIERTNVVSLYATKWTPNPVPGAQNTKWTTNPVPGVHISSYKSCYGSPNEVETIISDIYTNKVLDKCTVALTDASTYSQLFFDYALLYDIPVTFGCGVPILNSNPGRLLVLYYHWISDGFFGKESVTALLQSKAFDKGVWRKQFPEAEEGFSWSKFYEVLGGLRLTNDEAINEKRIADYKQAIEEEEKIIHDTDEKAYRDFVKRKLCIPFLEIVAGEFALPTEDFIAKYSYIRKGSSSDNLLMKIDMTAISAIYDELGIIRRSGIDQSTDDLIKNALAISICGEPSEQGKLHITDISGALASTRENLYIAGLSANKFPGSPKENYLLLDADLKLFGKDAEYLTSEGRIKAKREKLLSLAKLATNLESKVYVSFAGLNVSELKKDNASSLVYELFRDEYGTNASSKDLEQKIEKIKYFEPAISNTREIGKAYNDGIKIVKPIDEYEEVDLDVNAFTDMYWSPSAINKFLDDPQAFMKIYLLNIPEPEEIDNFAIITPIAAGNIAHQLMERLANSDMSRDEFLSISEEYFDRHIKENPPLMVENVPEVKADFMEMMEVAYETETFREVIMKEKEIGCEHESGVKIHGLPDRVEKLEDGTYVVVDFKTGRTVKHTQDDIRTCLQVVIYAYLLEKQGYKVSRGEFRYLRNGETITCKYDDEMKAALNDVLLEFKDCLENFRFENKVENTDGLEEN